MLLVDVGSVDRMFGAGSRRGYEMPGAVRDGPLFAGPSANEKLTFRVDVVVVVVYGGGDMRAEWWSWWNCQF